MARTRTRWYEKHGISKERYIELKNVCLQYDQYKRKDRELRLGDYCRRGGNQAYSLPDPTGREAARNADSVYARKMRIIERAANEACGPLACAMLRHVTTGCSMEMTSAPCGRRQFFQLRREFFAILDRLWDECMF